ncbi:SusC/RagA family TonB-linked outer membrane protein [Sediminibacterium sp.]|uniref:SusC/RagA family TonB-linked outer membrane protein n=1 Tax=Sediminibacterium sp. TaxID=1917865 RepID=UPI002736B0B2|nr:SusC/RagA family TonB-linked outer membrane protein [Sediminibacterium sp.]MDP3392231.1 SusC/RagA family TonB-linked outer membrane protein [Sediminibacterium sp.]MDP3566967.1 SusC/RagA family TonB-linked outer membrane protein [Sediminibacterium sp.]
MNLRLLARPILLGAFACLFAIFSHAQTKTVTGKVTDSKDGSPLSGASVVAKGTSTGTQTGADGSFKLTVPSTTKTLVISFAGFGNVEVNISGTNTANAKLTSTADALTDVVVIGYGSRKSKDVTGSVARVTEKDFNKGQIASPDQLLQGRTPGVLVTPSTGEPGAAATINIRGTGSISGAQEPLYVIDGVPLIQGGTLGSASGVEGSTTPKNPLIFLNPNDIESITVLKDASAAAIYGSRGANGVILITTKQGRGGKAGVFNFGATTSMANTARRYDLMNAQDFLIAAKKANIDGGADPIAAGEAVKGIDNGASTDWQDQIFRQAISQNYNLSWAYSNKGTTARLSASLDDQQGIVRNSGLKRITARANLGQKLLNDKLKLEANITYSNTKNQYAPLSNNAGYQGSLLGAALQLNPTNPVYNRDGSFFQPGDQRNPVQMLAYFDDRDFVNRFLTNLSATYQITPSLSYRAVLGLDNSKSERTAFADPRLGANAYGGTINVYGRDYQNPIQGNGRGTRQNLETKSTLIEHYFTYDKTFNNVHAINAVAGYSYQSFQTSYTGNFGWGLNTPVVAPTDVFVRDYSKFKNYANFVPGFDRNELQSVFARVNYTYNDKYFFTATVRSDGSSKFGSNNRYGTFPAFAFKWRVMEESWAKNTLGKLFSEFNIRANYGKLGSQDNLGSYAALNLQQTFDVGSGPVTRFIQQGNPDLKWEEVATTGIGVDFTSKNGRLSATVDYYKNERTNMLFFAPTPGGFAPQSNWWINLPGNVTNKGWEVSVNYKVIKGNKFNWDVNANVTTVSNNVTGLPTPINTGAVSGQGLTGAFAQTLTNGSPIFTWSMPVFQGFDGNGNARYAAGAANQLVGTALPKMFAGLTNNFSYGRWNLSVFLNAVTGHYIYNNTANALLLKGSLRNARNVTNVVGNGPENPFNPGSVSTRFLEKGDFIRLANMNLSYAFDIKGKAIKTLTAFASGQNLALFSKYSGIDPEVNVDKSINGIPSRGFDYTQYPRPTVITLGINVGF